MNLLFNFSLIQQTDPLTTYSKTPNKCIFSNVPIMNKFGKIFQDFLKVKYLKKTKGRPSFSIVLSRQK